MNINDFHKMVKYCITDTIIIAEKSMHDNIRSIWNEQNKTNKLALLCPSDLENDNFMIDDTVICKIIKDQVGYNADIDWYFSHLVTIKIK